MAINRTPVLKRCRSLGLEPSYLGVNKTSRRKNLRGQRKVSEYGLQLREKQKAKFIYGVQEKPFRNMFEKAEKMPGLVGTNLMQLLEMRLDNIVFRLGFARTRREARQIVSHKHVTVNGKVVNIPSYKVSPEDVIEIKEKSKSLQRFKDIAEANANIAVPAWLDVDSDKLSGKVSQIPLREQIDVPVNETLIVELYSK
ncbi:MAG: 30S ribosomal protein S4 [Eubacterium sp.]|jgi:small subunit ribosomal protein S4|nr:30S ribosomal protein S4 [Eubacterium sp.]